jgi:hypothetical protein
MSSDIEELKERISGLSDEELIEMVTVSAGDYRQEATDYAKAELTKRGIDFSAAAESAGESPATLEPFPTSPESNPNASTCAICGGELRAGTLVGEKELTIVFSDNREERFIKVNACVRCGHLSLVADFDTSVDS